jgi:hypothetical protein
MKVTFVMRTVAHFPYHEPTIRHLCARGHNVEVLYDRELSDGDSDHAARALAAETTGLEFGWSIRRRGFWRGPLFAARELLSYSSYLNRRNQAEFYLKRWQRYLPRGTARLMASSSLARKLMASALVRSALRTWERLAPADAGISRGLKSSRPDVVVASPINMRYSEEVEYVKAARVMGIPTVVPVLSWDNLTTKGLFHVIPDLTLVWNRSQADEAMSIHGVPQDRIVITGAPFLDKWFEGSVPPLEEATFRDRVGLDKNTPFVLYLGSSANIARDESWLVSKLAASLRASPDERARDMEVLVRPHGANQEIYRKVSAPNLRLWFRDQALPDSPESFAEFAASLRYSVCAVGLNTTGMVDALLADRPVIALLVEEYQNSNASQAVHFRYLLDAGVYERAQTTDTCAQLVVELLDGKDRKQEERHRFAIEFVRPHGRGMSAGEAAAKTIEMAARRRSAADIREAIDASIAVGEMAGR